MNPLFVTLCFTLVVAQFAVPRRFAFLPLLIATCHFPNVPVIEAGAIFSITKLVIMAGLLRAAGERKLRWSSSQPLDVLIAVWASWAIVSGYFHHPPDHNPMTVRLSLVYDHLGTYLYARSFLRSPEDLLRFGKCLAIVILPLAAMMTMEAISGQNVYAAFGATLPMVRDGRIRANGPFGHAILAGTVGAACLPLIMPIFRSNFWLAVTGFAACAAIAVSSNSSGPLMTLASALVGLGLWQWRTSLRWIKAGVVAGLIALAIVMKAPIWYLITRIDLTGSSTSYYRAELITQALNHLEEWWLTGTDYTSHWMASGSLWSGNQADITNYYIKMGVTGGLPLMLLFIAIFFKAFQLLGRKMRRIRLATEQSEFTLWCVGATLFAYSTTFISVTFFDQSYVFFCLLIGAVPGITSDGVSHPSALAEQYNESQSFDPARLPYAI